MTEDNMGGRRLNSSVEHSKTVVTPPSILENLNIQLAGRHTARARARVFDVKTGDRLDVVINYSGLSFPLLSPGPLTGGCTSPLVVSTGKQRKEISNFIIIIRPERPTGCKM